MSSREKLLSCFTIVILILTSFLGYRAARAQGGDAEADVSYLWRVLNGSHLSKNSEKFSELLAIYKKSGATALATAIVNDPQSTVVTSHVRTLFTPLAGREKSFTEASGDFVLGAMLSTLQEKPVDQMLLDDVHYDLGRSTGETIHSKLNALTTDGSLKSAERTSDSQRFSSDPSSKIGLITSDQYGQSIFSGGTNRRAVKKITEDFLCKPIVSLMNFSISDRWVGRDIPRAPGNDSKVYLNRCMGCHTGIDSLRGAFAGYDFTDIGLVWGKRVQMKLNNNPKTSPEGFVVRGDTWEHLGWLPIAPEQLSTAEARKYQHGPKAFMQMIVGSRDYFSCLTQQVKERLCRDKKADSKVLDAVITRFQKHKILKTVFADVASQVCLDDRVSLEGVSNRYQLVRQLEIATGLGVSQLRLDQNMLAKLPNSGRIEEINGTFLRTWSQLTYSSCKISANSGDLKSRIQEIKNKKLSFEAFMKGFYEKNLGETPSVSELNRLSSAPPGDLYNSVISACSIVLASPKFYLLQKQ